MVIPSDLKYTDEHEWVRVKKEEVSVGITDHAQKELGDIVFVELPIVGDEVRKGEDFMVIESVKSVSDIYAPVSGEVKAVNEELESAPELINQSPYEDGWLAKIEISDDSELDDLLSAEKYEDIAD